MPSRFIETNNIKLHVVTDGPGDGTPVILLHGFPEFHYGWRRQIPAFGYYKDRHEEIEKHVELNRVPVND